MNNQYKRMQQLAGLLNEEDKKYTIFCDMDGVLTDFDTRFMEFSDGIPPSEYESKMGKEAFWNLIDVKIGLKFWTEMGWMSDGHQLWNYIKQYKPMILSAPSRNPVSSKGKKEWIRRELPGTKLILKYSDEKKELAQPNHILIDDREKNIQDWISAKGIGILHTSASDTIKQLKKLGL